MNDEILLLVRKSSIKLKIYSLLKAWVQNLYAVKCLMVQIKAKLRKAVMIRMLHNLARTGLKRLYESKVKLQVIEQVEDAKKEDPTKKKETT